MSKMLHRSEETGIETRVFFFNFMRIIPIPSSKICLVYVFFSLSSSTFNADNYRYDRLIVHLPLIRLLGCSKPHTMLIDNN
jgi:hypothetical protein